MMFEKSYDENVRKHFSNLKNVIFSFDISQNCVDYRCALFSFRCSYYVKLCMFSEVGSIFKVLISKPFKTALDSKQIYAYNELAEKFQYFINDLNLMTYAL